jgi:hypothetical protein
MDNNSDDGHVDDDKAASLLWVSVSVYECAVFSIWMS